MPMHSSNSAASPLLDDEAVATWLCVSPRTIQSWRSSGDGPRFVKFGRSVRYRAEDVAAFIDSRVFASTGGAAA